MKRALYVLAIVAMIAAIIAFMVHMVYRERQCNVRGGVLVKGAFDYVCVAAAKVAA